MQLFCTSDCKEQLTKEALGPILQSDSESGTFSASDRSDVKIVYPSSDYYESALISMGIGPSYSTITWTFSTNESAHSVSQPYPRTDRGEVRD